MEIREIKVIEIIGERYNIRHHYLHRGTNPRLVLDAKRNGRWLFAQFDNNGKICYDLERLINPDGGKYPGILSDGKSYDSVEITIVETH